MATATKANSIVPSFVSATFNGVDFTYVYSVSENAPNSTNQSRIDSGTASTLTAAGGTALTTNGDFFELIDFGGYVAGSATSGLLTVGGASWSISVTNGQLIPVTGATVPDGAAPDIIFQYVGTGGGTLSAQSIVTPVGLDLALGTITLHSTIAPTTLADRYVGQDFNTTTPGSQTANNGFVDGPTAVPLPSAAWMGLSTLLAAGVVAGIRKRVRMA
jgi:hypothetical protein